MKDEIRNASNSALAGTYRVDTLVFTADWSQTLLYRNDTAFITN